MIDSSRSFVDCAAAMNISPSQTAAPVRIGEIEIPGRVLLAPMASVTDLPFRRAAAKQGAGYTVSEMVVESMVESGRRDMVNRARLDTSLGLSVMQLIGRTLEEFSSGAAFAEKCGADIIDINMGCPSRQVVSGACGSALMLDLDYALTLIRAAIENTSRPVTVKMRLGWDVDHQNAVELAQRAEEAGVKAVTVHGRTRNQFFKGEANWAAVAPIKDAVGIPVFVNGDIVDGASALAAMKASGADGVMVGRAARGQPWIVRQIEQAIATGQAELAGPAPGPKARFEIVSAHMRDSIEFYGFPLGLQIFRKHLAAYIDMAPWPEDDKAKRKARSAMCQMKSAEEVEAALAALWQV